MKKRLQTILIMLILLTGVSLILYPSVSSLRHRQYSSQLIGSYSDSADILDNIRKNEAWKRAVDYNNALYLSSKDAQSTEMSESEYETALNPFGNGMMSYIDIPKINCSLPVFHGTDEETLEKYVGHLSFSSLPVGGNNTHCVLTGHTGMPNARLLTDIDKLEVGDRFTITTLDRTLTYEVDYITIALPYQTDSLKIQEGQDLCTLVTCTPRGVNSHRLLVRGRRVESASGENGRPAEGFWEILSGDFIFIALAAIMAVIVISLAVIGKMENRKLKRVDL